MRSWCRTTNPLHGKTCSKTLTTTQSNYSNIERECLAVVFSIQRFQHYLNGRPFTVKSDHKPLEMIMLKSLHVAPPRLQRMLTQIQGNDFKFMYKPGPELVLADTLSRFPNVYNGEDIKLDQRMDSVMIDSIGMDLLHVAPVKQNQLREETTRDNALRALGQSYTLYGQTNSMICQEKSVTTGVTEKNLLWRMASSSRGDKYWCHRYSKVTFLCSCTADTKA